MSKASSNAYCIYVKSINRTTTRRLMSSTEAVVTVDKYVEHAGLMHGVPSSPVTELIEAPVISSPLLLGERGMRILA